jgi:RNA polymerase sigma factor (sigma-70 family)
MECRAALTRAVGRIVRRHDIDDILQDAYVLSSEAANRHSILNPRAFLLRTATNLALNHVNRAGYKRTTGMADLSLEDVYVDGGASPEQLLDADRQFRAFCRAVGGVPPQSRRAFVLMKIYGLSQREVAARLGISENTVEKHVAKGLLMCRTYMESVGCAVESESREAPSRPEDRKSPR